ncbi:hypothetical protein AAFF_G00423170 [Aldrovandia affinis]|uniref:Uncharacterized protein n=1 Tax=Aldrovandia affinis TaxID=143900 RepID=A0AAD7T6Q9_9TELE|nr:hypothetical protein AAFF_G00423170 [Aldrovandia affinis]
MAQVAGPIGAGDFGFRGDETGVPPPLLSSRFYSVVSETSLLVSPPETHRSPEKRVAERWGVCSARPAPHLIPRGHSGNLQDPHWHPQRDSADLKAAAPPPPPRALSKKAI